MNLLIIDSSSSFLQVSLKTKSRGDFTYTCEQVRPTTNAYLAKAVEFLSRQATISLSDLDLLIGVGGPGSFTGLRVGMAFIKGLSCALNLPFVFINTLEALSFPYLSSYSTVLSVIDARKARVYAALYQANQRVSPYWDIEPENLYSELRGLALTSIKVVGNASAMLQRTLGDRLSLEQVENPLDTLRGLETLGVKKFQEEGTDPHGCSLFYIRESDAVAVNSTQSQTNFFISKS